MPNFLEITPELKFEIAKFLIPADFAKLAMTSKYLYALRDSLGYYDHYLTDNWKDSFAGTAEAPTARVVFISRPDLRKPKYLIIDKSGRRFLCFGIFPDGRDEGLCPDYIKDGSCVGTDDRSFTVYGMTVPTFVFDVTPDIIRRLRHYGYLKNGEDPAGCLNLRSEAVRQQIVDGTFTINNALNLSTVQVGLIEGLYVVEQHKARTQESNEKEMISRRGDEGLNAAGGFKAGFLDGGSGEDKVNLDRGSASKSKSNSKSKSSGSGSGGLFGGLRRGFLIRDSAAKGSRQRKKSPDSRDVNGAGQK